MRRRGNRNTIYVYLNDDETTKLTTILENNSDIKKLTFSEYFRHKLQEEVIES